MVRAWTCDSTGRGFDSRSFRFQIREKEREFIFHIATTLEQAHSRNTKGDEHPAYTGYCIWHALPSPLGLSQS